MHEDIASYHIKSNGVDKDGLPFRLYFYNMALGESYLVVVPPTGLVLNQSLQRNMIWEYSLTMTAIAPLEAVAGEQKAKQHSLKFVRPQQYRKV